MKHNDLEIENWKDCDINTDSLWLINEKDKSGKHANFYHGKFGFKVARCHCIVT